MVTTRQCIDKQTARVPLALASLCLWKVAAPVLRLPVEILAHIFLYCARRDYRESWDDVGVPQWVNVSYVCSHWRYVALSCPTLWSYLFVASPRWTELLLVRSKKIPLWMRIYFTPINRGTALEFMDQVAPHAERFRECRLTIQSEDVGLVLPMLSLRSAPLLRTLAITCKQPHYWNRVDLDAEDFDVDEDTEVGILHTLFNGDTPALRELHPNDHLFTWCSPTLRGLTVLRLRDLHYSVQPTITELRVVLSHMPDLAQLYLDDAIRGGRHNPARLDAEKVHLPRLVHLLVVAPFSRTVRFLSCIDIPVTARVRLGCSLENHSDGSDYAPFYALLSQMFGSSENEATSVAPIRTMVMDNGLRCISVVFSKSERRCHCKNYNMSFFKDCDCDVPLKVNIDYPSQAKHWNDLVVGICRSVPLARLKNLIQISCHLPPAFWFDIIWHLQELRYIELIGGDLSDIVIMLSLSPRPRPLPENTGRPTDLRTSQPFAPSLEELCLNEVRIPRGIRCGGNPSMHGSQVMLFRNTLVRRSATGHALKRLFIHDGSSFSQKEVTSLGQVVPQVEVHGPAMFIPDDEYLSCEDCREETSEELGSDGLSDDDSLKSVVCRR